MKIRSFILFLTLAGALPVVLSACDSEGPAEKAGKNADEATERAGDAAENAMGRAEEKTEEMGDKVERQTEN